MKSEKKTRKAKTTRTQIMVAAQHLFCKKGYDQTTMRDIAQESQVALGAAYYYFKNKQELVLAFYSDTQEAAEKHHIEFMATQPSFKDGMRDILMHRFHLLTPFRPFLSVLTRFMDPGQPISPFSEETKDLRERSIKMIAEAVEQGNTKPSKTLEPFLPLMLWLVQMGLVFFWLHDHSAEQKRTKYLVELSLEILEMMIRMSRSPLFRKPNRKIKELMEIVAGSLP